MSRARFRPSRAYWASLVTSLTVPIQISCASDATSPAHVIDASTDTEADADDEPTPTHDAALADSSDGFIPCTPGDEPIACFAILTGCPSLSYCSERFGLMCPCRSCTWTLEPGVCSWTVTVENPGLNIVERVGIDGGRPQRLQQVEPGPCGDDEFGFFVTRVPGTITVTLCPASCAEHEDDLTLTFTLARQPCPPP
jgi:hypothetical protein